MVNQTETVAPREGVTDTSPRPSCSNPQEDQPSMNFPTEQVEHPSFQWSRTVNGTGFPIGDGALCPVRTGRDLDRTIILSVVRMGPDRTGPAKILTGPDPVLQKLDGTGHHPPEKRRDGTERDHRPHLFCPVVTWHALINMPSIIRYRRGPAKDRRFTFNGSRALKFQWILAWFCSWRRLGF